jgi:hypothetical protein
MLALLFHPSRAASSPSAGDRDDTIKRRHTEYIAATIPHARALILPNTSHFAFLQAEPVQLRHPAFPRRRIGGCPAGPLRRLFACGSIDGEPADAASSLGGVDNLEADTR